MAKSLALACHYIPTASVSPCSWTDLAIFCARFTLLLKSKHPGVPESHFLASEVLLSIIPLKPLPPSLILERHPYVDVLEKRVAPRFVFMMPRQAFITPETPLGFK